MEVYHEKFGTGEILKSTEQFDEAGNIISADVMFEHGIEQDVQLDELSKKTLGSYVKKAANDSSDRTGYAGELHQKASDLDNPRDNLASQKRILSDRDKQLRIANKRRRGISKAVNKLTKEEIEDLENDILDIVDEAVNSALNEKLIGNQKKIDANKNGKIDAEDFKKLRKEEVSESVVVAPRMTPDSASMRMPAVESVVRDIMSQHRNIRQEAKVAEFKSRNK